MTVHNQTDIILFVLTLLTVLIFLFSLVTHILSYRRPTIQSCNIRIQLIVLTSSICAMISYQNPKLFPWMEVIKGFAEAYCLYTFWCLLIFYVGGIHSVHHIYRTEARGQQAMIWNGSRLFCCVGPYICPTSLQSCLTYQFKSTKQLVSFHYWCVLQLLISRPLCFLCIAFLQWSTGETAIAMLFQIIAAVAMILTMQILLTTYMALKPRLYGYRVVLKFLLIKLIVLITITQNFILGMLVNVDVITPNDSATSEAQVAQWNASLTICESFVCAALLAWMFSTHDRALHTLPHKQVKPETEPSTIRDLLVSPTELTEDLLPESFQSPSHVNGDVFSFYDIPPMLWYHALLHVLSIWDIVIYDLTLDGADVV